ncbi:hypothetical protein QJS10_CPB04g00426 [Acorus calamus]|uniref:Uncharacterized protein n=1 Tax=Acorus calamus TaxID=4465 RepID=A0AAV9F266_ACOCL|nr:hypothetical protein QJS10_CPB04g00426 [Acorus calamus]
MFRLLRENLLRVRINGGGSSSPASKTSLLCFFHENPSLKSITHSSESTPTDPKSSLTVSYLISSCGLSPEAAIKASKWVTLKNTKNADLVLDCLRNHGFESTHIAKVIGRRPDLLKLHPERTLRPKMDFLMRSHSVTRSLENQIIPCFGFLDDLVGTQENVIAAINRSAYIMCSSRQKRLVPNASMFCMVDPDRFRTSVVAVHGMGFNPLSTRFVEAVRAILISKSGWDEKYELCRSLGWSDVDFMSAFRMCPQFKLSSEKKIKRVFEFFVGELGWEPPSLSRCPVLISLNLEKRVIPRCLVLEVLLSKGLIEKDMKWSTALKITEKQFLDRFVSKNEEEAAELMRAYNGMTKSE